MSDIRFKVTFGNGLPDDVHYWAVPGRTKGFLDIRDDRLRIADVGLPASAPTSEIAAGGSPGGIRWSEDSIFCLYDLKDLRFVAYEGIGTKSNVAALAIFGALGLGARRQWTLITVGFADRDAQFLTRASTHEVRASFQAASESSPTLDSLLVEGTPPSVSTHNKGGTSKGLSNPLDELERLARLYQDGLLTDDEYTAMKAKLIADT